MIHYGCSDEDNDGVTPTIFYLGRCCVKPVRRAGYTPRDAVPVDDGLRATYGA